jgi:putative membrane protein
MQTAHDLTATLVHSAWWGGPGGPGAPGWFWVIPVAWLAFWLVLAGLLGWYLLSGRRRSGLDSARRILAERYASGELTSDEYRQRLSDLR